MDVTRQAGALGAIVTGVDLASGVDEVTFKELHDALLEHLVICVRGQGHITPETRLRSRSGGAASSRTRTCRRSRAIPTMRVYDPNPITVTRHADLLRQAAAVGEPAVGPGDP
jgi:taurine dioxygenase